MKIRDLLIQNPKLRTTLGVAFPDISKHGGLLVLKDANTFLDVDGNDNLTFTDVVTGTRTLSQLATETDPIFSISAASTITGTQISNWDTAYGWGDHSTAGCLTAETDPQVGINTINYVPKWDGTALVTGSIFDNGNIGIGTTSPGGYELVVYGNKPNL